MVVTLTINGTPVSPSDEGGIAQQINRRLDDDASICVRIEVKSTGIDLVLATAGCRASGGGGGRRANEREQHFIDLWNQLQLSEEKVAVGRLIAFLRQVRRFE